MTDTLRSSNGRPYSPQDENDAPKWGVVLRSPRDPALDVRYVESLGLDHVVLPGNDPVAVLLALGATHSLRVYADDLDAWDWIHRIPAEQRARLHERPADMKVTPTRVTATLGDEDHPVADPCEGAIQELDGLVGTIGECRARLAALERTGLRHVAFDLIGNDTDRRRSLLWLALDVLQRNRWDGRTLYAQDLAAGMVFELGRYTVTEEEVLSFALKWDPVDLHIDAGLAALTPLGRLCASGVHTQAILQYLTSRVLFRRVAVVAGRRSLGMKFLVPVTPGMRLRGRMTIIDVRIRSHGRAVVTIEGTLHHGAAPVYEMRGELVVQQR